MIELVFKGVFGIHHPLPCAGALERLWQAMVGLRSDDYVDGRLATGDLVTLRLGDAAGNADHELTAFGGARLFRLPQPAERRIDLFGRLLADMAGVQENQIGIVHRLRRHVALGGERIGHAAGIVDVHLAAIGLDEDLAFGNGGAALRLAHGVEECGVLCHAGYLVVFPGGLNRKVALHPRRHSRPRR